MERPSIAIDETLWVSPALGYDSHAPRQGRFPGFPFLVAEPPRPHPEQPGMWIVGGWEITPDGTETVEARGLVLPGDCPHAVWFNGAWWPPNELDNTDDLTGVVTGLPADAPGRYRVAERSAPDVREIPNAVSSRDLKMPPVQPDPSRGYVLNFQQPSRWIPDNRRPAHSWYWNRNRI